MGSLHGAAAKLNDLGEGRLQDMDAGGVDVQVLSAVSHPIQELEPHESERLSREVNDRMAALTVRFPDRFRAFAALPMSDPARAVDELERAVGELGFVGGMVQGQTRGVFLDDPSCDPVLTTVERLGVPLYLHPGWPPAVVYDTYFSGLEPETASMLARGAWGWHAECGLHVLRMTVGGVFERHPQLQLMIGHMGENLPFSLARADEWLTPFEQHVDDELGAMFDAIAARGRADLIDAVCEPLPVLTICAVIGLDREEAAAIHLLRRLPAGSNPNSKREI
ncbi:MAG: amidohydrolase family protein [Solirubrobacterales bacterium]